VPPAPRACFGQDGDPGRTQIGHVFHVDDEFTNASSAGLRLQARVQQRSGEVIDLARDLDDHAPARGGRECGH